MNHLLEIVPHHPLRFRIRRPSLVLLIQFECERVDEFRRLGGRRLGGRTWAGARGHLVSCPNGCGGG